MDNSMIGIVMKKPHIISIIPALLTGLFMAHAASMSRDNEELGQAYGDNVPLAMIDRILKER